MFGELGAHGGAVRRRRPGREADLEARGLGAADVGATGAPMHPGDMVAQFKLAWKNLVEVLAAANMQPKNIVRLNFYTTDVDQFMAKAGDMIPVYAATGCKPANSLSTSVLRMSTRSCSTGIVAWSFATPTASCRRS